MTALTSERSELQNSPEVHTTQHSPAPSYFPVPVGFRGLVLYVKDTPHPHKHVYISILCNLTSDRIKRRREAVC